MKNNYFHADSLLELIPIGEENCITTSELSKITGYDVRTLKRAIHSLRIKGAVILSKMDGFNGGYYMPANKREVEEYVRREHKRILSFKQSLYSAEKYLR